MRIVYPRGLVILLLSLCSAPLIAEDKAADIGTASIEDLGKWVTNYYRKPDPETIPARVRRMSQLEMLVNGRPEANHMFLGQLMRANPKKIAAWMNGWKDLPPKDRDALHHAVWLSQTAEGKKWLADNGQNELAAKEGHPLVTGEAMVLEPYHVDMLWEWFFATGDKAPIRQVVGKFNMLNADPGDADLPPKPAPGTDRPTYLRQMIGGVAVWSASSLAARHERLLEILVELQSDPQLPDRGGKWLARAIDLAKRDRKSAAK